MAIGSESSRRAVAIVTGGSFPIGRQVARGLAGWDWPIIVVYLEHKRAVDAAVTEILWIVFAPRSRVAAIEQLEHGGHVAWSVAHARRVVYGTPHALHKLFTVGGAA